jgi:hypothetical protein
MKYSSVPETIDKMKAIIFLLMILLYIFAGPVIGLVIVGAGLWLTSSFVSDHVTKLIGSTSFFKGFGSQDSESSVDYQTILM